MQQNPTASQQHKQARRPSAHRAKPAATAARAAPRFPGAEQPGTEGVRRSRVQYSGAGLPYLLVLAGVLAGLLIAFGGSRYAGRGIGLVGGTMLAAGLARLVLPPRHAGLLASRHKALDVLTFVVLGGGVLGFALWLP